MSRTLVFSKNVKGKSLLLTVNELLLSFLQDRSFAGRVANALPIVIQPGLGTMAIGVHNKKITLFIDPEFIERISMPFGHFCMEHEILGHYANAHIPRFLEFLSRWTKPEDKERARDVMQIGADCAVNSMLRKTKYFKTADAEMLEYSKWKHPGEQKEGETGALIIPERYQLPEDKSFEWYISELMKKSGLGSRRTGETEAFYEMLKEALKQLFGSHGKWPGAEGLETMSPEELSSLAHQLHNQTKHLLRKVMKEIRKGRGTVPGDLVEWLDEYLAEPVVPWWEVLSARIFSTKRVKIESGIERPDRVLLALSEEEPGVIPMPGSVEDATWRILFLEDVSGSMDRLSIEIGRNELQHILMMDDEMEVRWVQFDADATFDHTYVHGDELPNEAHGRGGTDFDAAFKYILKDWGKGDNEPDAVIVFTDGGAPAVNMENWLPPEIPVIWCVTREGAGNHLEAAGYGEVIICDESQNKAWKEAHEDNN